MTDRIVTDRKATTSSSTPAKRLFPSDIAFTDAVKRLQREAGSRPAYARMEREQGWRTTVTPDLAAFLADRDMFYLGTANAEGQPYIQYRGGAPGFLKVVDERTLGFADFGGNRQFITVGNAGENPKAFLFLIDYEASRRVKVWGRMRVVADDPQLLERLTDREYSAGRPERAVLFTVEAWDVNCPQHIHRRVLKSRADAEIAELRSRVAELSRELDEARRSA
ncbi:MAG: pyridoxamine 5'-phosphate oxidase family protein [Planctomycetota bacterium]